MRTSSVAALALALVVTADVAPARAQVQQGGTPTAAIAARNAEFMAAFGRGDAAAIAALYSEDGQALPPNGATVSGRAALAGMWKGAIDMGLTGVTLETLELHPGGDMATEVGRYRLATADGAVADEGKFIVLWKRVGGTWYLHRDIWNSDRAAARPADAVVAPPAPAFVDRLRAVHRAANYVDALLAADLLAPDVEWWAAGDSTRLPWAGTRRGADGIRDFSRVLGRHMRYTAFAMREYVVGADQVAVTIDAGGTARATGRPFASAVVRLYDVRDGRIVRVRSFYDTDAYARAMAVP